MKKPLDFKYLRLAKEVAKKAGVTTAAIDYWQKNKDVEKYDTKFLRREECVTKNKDHRDAWDKATDLTGYCHLPYFCKLTGHNRNTLISRKFNNKLDCIVVEDNVFVKLCDEMIKKYNEGYTLHKITKADAKGKENIIKCGRDYYEYY